MRRVEYLNPAKDFPEIERIWTALGIDNESYFLSWPWMENWLRTLPQPANVSLVVLRDGGEPLLAFFLGSKTLRRHRLLPSRALFLNETGIPMCDSLCLEYNGVLVQRGVSADLPQIIEMLPKGWEEFFLSSVNADSGLLCNSPGIFKVIRRVDSAFVDLRKARQAAEYLSLISMNTRSQIRRAYRVYAEQHGEVHLKVAASLDEAREIYAELKQLHQTKWTGKGLPGAFGSEYFDLFHRRLIETRFSTGEIQLLGIRAGKKTVGCLYSFVKSGKVFYYQSGLALEQDNRLKPGYVCHTEAIRYNAAIGNDQYDFLGGADRYKFSLATDTRDVIWAVVQKPRLKFAVEEVLRHWKQKLFRRAAVAKGSEQPRPEKARETDSTCNNAVARPHAR